MSFGTCICSKYSREVYQSGQWPNRTWNHIDHTPLCEGAQSVYPVATESLKSQIDRLAHFIQKEVPGEPSQNEGAVDCAIRIMRQHLKPN